MSALQLADNDIVKDAYAGFKALIVRNSALRTRRWSLSIGMRPIRTATTCLRNEP
jgi:hypothetical protein